MAMRDLFRGDQHLVIHCDACDWRMRCTPAEACEIFGENTEIEDARHMVKACPRCSATGIGKECKIDLRGCISDYYAEFHYRRALNAVEQFPDDKTAASTLSIVGLAFGALVGGFCLELAN